MAISFVSFTLLRPRDGDKFCLIYPFCDPEMAISLVIFTLLRPRGGDKFGLV